MQNSNLAYSFPIINTKQHVVFQPWLSLGGGVVGCLEFITIAFLLSLAFGGLDADLLVILLEGGKILTGLGELTFLHTLTDVPVDEGTLGVHKIELMIDAGEDLGDGRGVGDHAHGAHDLGQVTTGDDGGGLVVDTALETGGAPVDELQ